MRYFGLALAASAVVLNACGGDKQPADTSQPAGGGTTAAAVEMKPITGKTVEVKMVQDAQGIRFDPAEITINSGDGIKFVTVSGAPHNVGFNAADIPAGVRPQLNANMPNTVAELMSPMLMDGAEDYVISFGGIPPGRYPFTCPVHIAQGMRGVITVQ